MRRTVIIFLALTTLLPGQRAIVPVPQQAGRRVALVIGNDRYPGNLLRNAVNDARDVSAALGALGFDTALLTDAAQSEMEAAIDRFIAKLHEGDSAVFYYSGHGIQLDGENFLIPVDFAAHDKAQAKSKSYSASLVHDRMQERRARLSVLILDACRNNPFAKSLSLTRDLTPGAGLATMSSGKGSLIAFATAPGATASDRGKGNNGLFTGYLLEALREPGLRLGEVFDKVREKVDAESQGAQVPWTVSSVIGEFVFNDPAARVAALAAENARKQAELEALQQARQSAASDAEKQRLAGEASQAQAELARIAREKEAAEVARKRQEELAGMRAKLDADEKERLRQQEARQRELDRAIREARQEAPKGMTLEEARAEVARLKEKIAATRAAQAAEKQKALRDLDATYGPLREALAGPLVKDQFETTAEFDERVRKQKEQSGPLEERYAAERAAVAKKFEVDGVKGDLDRIAAIEGRTYQAASLVEWVGYDADKQVLSLRAGARPVKLSVSRAIAQGMYARKSSLLAEVLYYEGSSEADVLAVIDPVGPVRYPVPALPKAGQVKVNPTDGQEYVWIPPGTFRMGCSDGDSECASDEKPARSVTIEDGFWLGKTPVTQLAYQKVTGRNPSHFKGPNRPVESVDWNEARAYCEATGGRLPSEAEWEYAARAGSTGSRYGEFDSIAWYSENSDSRTHDVATKAPNAWGLFDMLGNVWQWTSSSEGSAKVMRGGSWSYRSLYVRVSNRVGNVPAYRSLNIGFRCAGD